MDQFEVHDKDILANACLILEQADGPAGMAQEVVDAVARNEEWRGKRCINLLAPEAPTSPTVRNLLSAEIGTRAAEGHIGRVNRWFAGTQYIDEVESLCVELLKKAFRCNYADHRLMGSMIGNMAFYHALAQPGERVMTAAQPFGGHSSNRYDGPAGTRGVEIFDVPFDAQTLDVDLDKFEEEAGRIRPKLVVMGMSMTLFPLPVREMTNIISLRNGTDASSMMAPTRPGSLPEVSFKTRWPRERPSSPAPRAKHSAGHKVECCCGTIPVLQNR